MEYLDIFEKLLSVAAILVPACLWVNHQYAKKHNSRSLFTQFVYRIKYAKSRFFYDERLTKQIVVNQRESTQRGHFIDYSIANYNHYYVMDQTSVLVRMNGEEHELRLPYCILADYVDDDSKRIFVDETILKAYELPRVIKDISTPVLKDFLNKKPDTYNDTAIRINSLYKEPNEKGWRCILQQTNYFTQIRTNLTLDVQIPNDYGKEDTLRQRDMLQAELNRLPAFENSFMANSIGVSAIWSFTSKVSKKNSHGRLFFLKPRKQGTGVFCNMLGTISGVVKFPQNGTLNESFLETYLENEILREFFEETGYDKFMEDKGITKDKIKVVPLAFAREFARGGKPQFFFLIITPEISNCDMIKYYKKSLDGFNEFDDTFIKNHVQELNVSPETSSNFIYALKYIQKNRNCTFVDLD